MIDRALQAGYVIREIAGQFQVSKTALGRHKTSHVQEFTVPAKRDKVGHAPTDRAHRSDAIVPRKQGENIAPDLREATKAAFLTAFVELANESGACDVVQIDRSTIRYWEEHDADFSPRYHDAKERVNDALRGEIWRRAKTGYDEEVATPKGEIVTIRKYSDRLIEFLAKARMPEFREKQQLDVTSNGQTVGQLNLEELATLMANVGSDLTAWRASRGLRTTD